MTCLVPNCPHPQSRDVSLCRWHATHAEHWRVDDELGLMRFCTGCGEDWPADESFFYPRGWRCRACVLEDYNRRRSERVAA